VLIQEKPVTTLFSSTPSFDYSINFISKKLLLFSPAETSNTTQKMNKKQKGGQSLSV
jgi:hypothetical protein